MASEKILQLKKLIDTSSTKFDKMIQNGDFIPTKMLSASLEMGLWLKLTSDYVTKESGRSVNFVSKSLLTSNNIEPVLKFKSPIKDIDKVGIIFKDIQNIIQTLVNTNQDLVDEDGLNRLLDIMIEHLNEVVSYDYHVTPSNGVVTHEDIHDVEEYFLINLDEIENVLSEVYGKTQATNGKINAPDPKVFMGKVIKFDTDVIEKIINKLKEDIKKLPISSNRTFNKCVTATRTTLTDVFSLLIQHDARATAAAAIKLSHIFNIYDETVVEPITRGVI